MANKTIPITKGRHDLFQIAAKVQKPNNYFTFSIDGEPKVVVMSHDEFASIMETIEILSDPEVMADLKQAEKDFKNGDYISWEKAKMELGWAGAGVVADQGKNKYKVKIKRHVRARKK